MAIPLGYPSHPREKVSLRSPLSDGGNASSSTELPIQEATTERRSLPWVFTDDPQKKPGNPRLFHSPGRQSSLRVSSIFF